METNFSVGTQVMMNGLLFIVRGLANSKPIQQIICKIKHLVPKIRSLFYQTTRLKMQLKTLLMIVLILLLAKKFKTRKYLLYKEQCVNLIY